MSKFTSFRMKIIFLTIFIGGYGCALTRTPRISDESWTKRPELSSVERESAEQLADGINTFAVDLYKKIGSEQSLNFSFSPASISVALMMTLGGAKGQTAKEIRHVLHLKNPDGQSHQAMSAILGHWSQPRDPRSRFSSGSRRYRNPPINYYFELSVANRLFGQEDYEFEQPFLELTKNRYGAPFQPMNFRGNPNGSRRAINEWIRIRTRNRIRNLIPSGGINSDTRLSLINAMYFKAGWMVPFFSSKTFDGTFMAEGKRRVTVDMMKCERFALYAHYQDDGLRVLELPYIERDFSMMFFLPEEDDGLPELEKILTGQLLRRWSKTEPREDVKIMLPKFHVEASDSIPLKQPLKELGLKTLFHPEKCDLSGISGTVPPLMIEEIYHRSFVTVHEVGTEAAALTYVSSGMTPAYELPPEFIADHPFVFLIRDRATGAILFMGRVVDPSQ